MRRWTVTVAMAALLVGRSAGAADGGQRTADGGQRTADGGQRTADAGQRTADAGQRTADSGQRTADGGQGSRAGVTFGVAAPPAGQKDKPAKSPRELRVGPLVGLGVPGGIEAGAAMTYRRFLGAGVQIGTIPGMRVPGVPHQARVTRFSVEAGGRVYPLKGALFLGAAIGYANLEATLDQKYTGYGVSAPGHVRAELSSVYVKPEVGFLWKWDMGLMLGADLGVVVPMAARESQITASAGGQQMDVKGKVADVLSTAGRTPLPALGLLRVGWLM
jgi:hypothetical protein